MFINKLTIIGTYNIVFCFVLDFCWIETQNKIDKNKSKLGMRMAKMQPGFRNISIASRTCSISSHYRSPSRKRALPMLLGFVLIRSNWRSWIPTSCIPSSLSFQLKVDRRISAPAQNSSTLRAWLQTSEHYSGVVRRLDVHVEGLSRSSVSTTVRFY